MTLRHAILVFQKMQHLRKEALTTPPGKWTSNMVHQTLSNMKGNRARVDNGLGSWCNVKNTEASAGRLGIGHADRGSTNVAALLGKHNSTEERSVTLVGCLCAIFTAGYKEDARDWDETYHGWWDDPVKGSAARDGCAKNLPR